MKNEIESQSGDASKPALGARGAARRRLAKAGLGATGVVLTLQSRNALAAKICASPSGFTSINANGSEVPLTSCTQNGSHGYWKNHPEAWDVAQVSRKDPFNKYFITGTRYAHLANVPLLGILEPNAYFGAMGKKTPEGFDPSNVAMQTIIAFLNARRSEILGRTDVVLRVEHVLGIWTDWVVKGGYQPAGASTPWGGPEIAFYFENTFQHD
jgi:hypothetical protein